MKEHSYVQKVRFDNTIFPRDKCIYLVLSPWLSLLLRPVQGVDPEVFERVGVMWIHGSKRETYRNSMVEVSHDVYKGCCLRTVTIV